MSDGSADDQGREQDDTLKQGLSFVAARRAHGHADQDISTELQNAGWSGAQIDMLFEACEEQTDSRVDGEAKLDPGNTLMEIAFRVTEATIELPAGSSGRERKEWLGTLRSMREDALEAKRETLAALPFHLGDPTDDPLVGWSSLAVLFDWNEMGGSYGQEVFEAFFHRVNPSQLKGEIRLYFGDLISAHHSICALAACTPNPADLVPIASGFGSEFNVTGLLAHETRFLIAETEDAHLIPRTFSLVFAATLKRGVIVPESMAEWMIEPSIKGTSWRT